jgi:hypothetical protein
MKKTLLIAALLASCIMASAQGKDPVKTTFQTSGPWKPVTDVRADAAMVYGVGGNPGDRNNRLGMTFEERVASWRDHGYITHFMTGIAWGQYQEYFTGEWDGKWHLDEGQVERRGDTIWHGHMVPYIVPSMNFIKYMKERHVKRVIDAGIDAIFMEEPEFWMRGGYSEAFKREWQDYYGFPWRAQHESPENTYLANKLKYHLYYRALNEVFTYAKEYGRSKGMDVKCYVPTHSLVNYSQWHIVSPEASLASLPCVDGYIAQVWTGTSRARNYFNGREKERVFETAYLEYGSMESMTAPTGRKMFFLTDPIEDNAQKDWHDYKINYQKTFTAQLLYPGIANYEVMPWPDRIYENFYAINSEDRTRVRIPRHFSTQMQVMINTLNKMPLSDNKVTGPGGISVLMANSLMFQSFPTHAGYEDPQLSNFFGQALPLLKRGVPVKTAHIENLGFPEALASTNVLLMTYANMKPMDPAAHTHIANWVKKGGVVIYSATDTDPFQTVLEWWNSGGNKFKAPADHLFGLMGIPAGAAEGEYRHGSGTVYVLRTDPKDFVLRPDGDGKFIDIVRTMYEQRAKAGSLTFKNSFYLERGPYTMIAVVDEGVNGEPYTIEGKFIDLFDPNLPVVRTRSVAPGREAYLFDVDRVADKSRPQVLAAASREYDEKIGANSYSFIAKSPAETSNVARVLLPAKPTSVLVNGTEVVSRTGNSNAGGWDEFSGTWLLRFENDPNGVSVEFKW